jgi:glycosyltransferase involved in cell wall biosynthesis
MNILFLTRYNPRDILAWSGTFYHMYHKLKERNHIEVFGNEIFAQLGFSAKDNFPNFFFIQADRYVKNLGHLLSERINLLKCDLIFLGDLFFHPLDINIPFVHCSDLTYEQSKIHLRKPDDQRNVEPCIHLEELTFKTSHRIIYCSEWIKRSVINTYKIDEKKIDVVEFGANIPTPTNYTIDIKMDICRLVFIGRNWEKKGGDKVLQAYRLLKKEGFPCTLTIIGSMPEETPDADEDLIIIPFLNKEKKEHLDKLCKILSESHFLVLPTVFDAYGIVFCEASAYGVPSIASNVGGVGQPVREGKNGFLLPPDATAQDYAEKIKSVFNDRENYIRLRASSRREFETRLNWDVWGERVNTILEDTVKEWKRTRT